MGIKNYRQFISLNEGVYTKTSDPIVPADIPFKCLEADNGEISIFQNVYTKKYYCFIFSDIDVRDFYKYAELPMSLEWTEDGKEWVEDSEEFYFDTDVLENYVNDNLNSLDYGEGLEDYESGTSNFILIDDDLRNVIKENFYLKSI